MRSGPGTSAEGRWGLSGGVDSAVDEESRHRGSSGWPWGTVSVLGVLNGAIKGAADC